MEWKELIVDTINFLEILEDDEDVQNVYHNLEITEELLSEM